MRQDFPIDYDDFFFAHVAEVPEIISLYVKLERETDSSDFGNVLNADGLAEIYSFCVTLESVTVEYDGNLTTFQDVCAKWDGKFFYCGRTNRAYRT